jgi:hypothetical protein
MMHWNSAMLIICHSTPIVSISHSYPHVDPSAAKSSVLILTYLSLWHRIASHLPPYHLAMASLLTDKGRRAGVLNMG